MILPKRITKRWLRSLALEALQAVEADLRYKFHASPTRVKRARWSRAQGELHKRWPESVICVSVEAGKLVAIPYDELAKVTRYVSTNALKK
jgi:hypothetical protein